MSREQIWALGIFGVVVLLMSIGLWPVSRKLNGAQKYRRLRRSGPDVDPEANRRSSMSPLAIALAHLTGGAGATSADTSGGEGVDGGDVIGDSGGDGGSGE